jgi:hypothetical protein
MRRTDLSTEEGRAIFFARVNRSVPGGCWYWLGSFFRDGYGRFKHGGRDDVAHRVSYELAKGPIPDWLELDHLCRNRGCVNPAHLEAVTGRVNVLRGETIVRTNAEKTHCSKGHPLSGDNLFIRRDGRRRCRTCERASQQRLRARPDAKRRHAEVERQRRHRQRELPS